MANPENIIPHQFKKGQSGNPKGRPKNRVRKEWLVQCFGKDRAKLIKALTNEEIDAWEQSLLIASTGELTIIAKWEECPSYAKNLALAILYDTKNGKTTTIDKLRERQYGKPVQKIELTGADGQPLMQVPKNMTQDEARDFLKQLEENC